MVIAIFFPFALNINSFFNILGMILMGILEKAKKAHVRQAQFC